MSQAGSYLQQGGLEPILTLTFDTGGAIPPNAGNINILAAPT